MKTARYRDQRMKITYNSRVWQNKTLLRHKEIFIKKVPSQLNFSIFIKIIIFYIFLSAVTICIPLIVFL